MLPKRLRISHAATETAKFLKARTGVTPNVLCRMGLILSLEQGPIGGSKFSDQNGSEFNAVTLFGEFGPLFDALIVRTHGELGAKEKAEVIVSHIDNGLANLRKSKTLLELIEHCGMHKHA